MLGAPRNLIDLALESIQLTKDAAGQPVEKAKLDQLERETLSKILKLLTPSQRAALAAPPKP